MRALTKETALGAAGTLMGAWATARLLIAKQGLGWAVLPAVAAISWPVFGLFAASMVFFGISVWLFMTDRRGAVRLFWVAFAADVLAFLFGGGLEHVAPILAIMAGVGLILIGMSAYRLRSRFTRAAV